MKQVSFTKHLVSVFLALGFPAGNDTFELKAVKNFWGVK